MTIFSDYSQKECFFPSLLRRVHDARIMSIVFLLFILPRIESKQKYFSFSPESLRTDHISYAKGRRNHERYELQHHRALLRRALRASDMYGAEADAVDRILKRCGRSGGVRLLDVACGTGGHLPFLKDRYEVEGLDLSEEMLRIARENHPDIPFHLADMTDFRLDAAYDAITACTAATVSPGRTTTHDAGRDDGAASCSGRNSAPRAVDDERGHSTTRSSSTP